MTTIRLNARISGTKRILSGHPWIFRDELVSPPEEGAGQVLPLFDGRGDLLGQGFYNPSSKIAFRLVTRSDRPVDNSFWRQRLEKAIAYRDSLKLDTDAKRLVYSEADGFPGLIVDAYGPCLSLQVLSLGMEGIRDLILDLLQTYLKPSAVVVRNESPVRKLEGLHQETGLLRGTLPSPLKVREGDLHFRVDLLGGQKTGAYLDQRENRLLLRRYAQGLRTLDAFCYEGWFALHLARAGAAEVMAMDTSKPALEGVALNAAMNGCSNVHPLEANCFEGLRALAEDGERFDLIVVDPPPFARRKSDIGAALRAYREINRRALACIRPGGLLFTCCCSHGVSQDLFSRAVAAAAGRARRRLVLLAQRLQALDHPIQFNEPESLYLKGMLFRCL
jgi:23S rRNA (cytosine1962-C5)-methyltransferase